MVSSNRDQDCRAATGFSKNAPVEVTSIVSRESPLSPYFLRIVTGIVIRPRVENRPLYVMEDVFMGLVPFTLRLLPV